MTDDELKHELVKEAYWKFDAMKSGANQWKHIPQSEYQSFSMAAHGLINKLIEMKVLSEVKQSKKGSKP